MIPYLLNICDFTKADGFAAGGLLLELASDVEDDGDTSKCPRYLAVENLSAHKNEKELLFCGKRVKLKITKIILSGTKKEHRTELRVLHKIHKLLRDQCTHWTDREKESLREYCHLRHMRYCIVLYIASNDSIIKVMPST